MATSTTGSLDLNANEAIIDSFCEITSASKDEAFFFLESHQWDLDSAVSTFFDHSTPLADTIVSAAASAAPPPPPSSAVSTAVNSPSPTESESPDYSPSQSPSRSRSRSTSPVPSRAPYHLRSKQKKPNKAAASGSRTCGNVRTFADLNRSPELNSDGSDDDEPQEYYTGGEKSGMLIQDPTKRDDVDEIFDHARRAGAVEGPFLSRSAVASSSFTGTGRLLSGETVATAPQPPPEFVNRTVILWRNGFTVDDGPLRRFGDPDNAAFLESIKKSECPKELEPADRRTQVHLNLMRREENYSEPERRQVAFQGVGRTLGSSSGTSDSDEPAVPAASFKTAPLPATGLVVDSSSPTTSIQLRLADGTRMVSHFNLHHTIRDIRGFIDSSRPGGARNYQLQIMGFPPKQLTNVDQTIEEAGIASSVVIQKF